MDYWNEVDVEQLIRCRGTRAVVDLGAIANNVRVVRGKIGPKCGLMVIIKADAYGHGAAQVAVAALDAGADQLGVATPVEGKKLRQAGLDVPILVMAPCLPEGADISVEFDLTQVVDGVGLCYALDAAAERMNRVVKVHVKLDTGMGRVGVQSTDDAVSLLREIDKLKHLEITGVMSHLACADSAEGSHSRAQLVRWEEMLAAIVKEGIDPGVRHIANSAATLFLPESHYDMVRLGIALYGLQPSDDVTVSELRPAMTFLTRIVEIKEFAPNSTIGYGGKFGTRRVSRIALLPVGYADGFMRRLSNHGRVIVRGESANIVGQVCMDLTMVDVTDIPEAAAGDDVLLFGGDVLSADEIARQVGTINYEIICAVSKRIPRVYVNS